MQKNTRSPLAIGALAAAIGPMVGISESRAKEITQGMDEMQVTITDTTPSDISRLNPHPHPNRGKTSGKRRKSVGISNPAHGNHKAFQKREAKRRKRSR